MTRFALKENDQFLVTDELGDISGVADGLFRGDTRILSQFVLRVGALAPSLLSSWVSHDNVYFRGHVTNSPLPELGGVKTPEGVIHIERARLLWEGRLYECISLANFGALTIPVSLGFSFQSDFFDISEVRGLKRAKRGRMLQPEIGADFVALGYCGLELVASGLSIATVTSCISNPSSKEENDCRRRLCADLLRGVRRIGEQFSPTSAPKSG